MADLASITILNAGGVRFTRDATVATYAVLLFEFFIVLDREYEVVYKSRWTVLKCLYLACRFSPLFLWPIMMYAFLFDYELVDCGVWVKASCIAFIPLLSFPQCIYVLRAWAFTGRKFSTLAVFLPCIVAYIGVVIWACVDDMTPFDGLHLLLGKTGCFRSAPHGYDPFARAILGGLGVDVVVGIAVAVHVIRVNQAQGRLGRLVLAQGVLFFPVMLALNIFAAVIAMGSFRGNDAMAFSVVIAISNIMACRFVIQIREFATIPDGNQIQLVSVQVRREVERTIDHHTDHDMRDVDDTLSMVKNIKRLTSQV